MPEDLEPDDEQPPDNSVIRGLREKADRADNAETRADNAERELTLHKAGLGTLTDKQQKALTAAHDGDWEPEALKATATELGFVQTGTDPPEPKGMPPEQEAAMRRVQTASNGEPSPPAPDLNDRINAAQNPEELKAVLRDAEMLAE